MNLSEYFETPGAMTVSELADKIGVKSVLQVRQWQHGYANRRPGPAYCSAIVRATGGQVTHKDLRPDDWHMIWPELVAQDKREVTHVEAC